MSDKASTIYYASSISEAQLIMKNISGISIVAGGTEIARKQTGPLISLPPDVLAIAKVPELNTVNKTERYIDFGSCMTMNDLIKLGRKNVPEVLFRAIRGIGNPAIRSIATIGGNISSKDRRLSTFAPLLALDARLEIRTKDEADWIPIGRYFSNVEQLRPAETELISKIRIPTENWDISYYRRLGRPGIIEETTASFVCLVKSQKDILSDIRIAWAGRKFFRNREFENLLIGRGLPLSEKEITNVLEKAEPFFSPSFFASPYEKKCLFNLLEVALRMLT
ncbi:FAD binding domain-containing protein [Brucepastera parasyntrophica]|uniref:FAD binding domain-containing protein n=1 Tax=Brucepastera parasyntrophica TaxID=2880008 RepID=UPI002109FDB4|nr:FAD binding domain-containing protein [Brucepastera parasyntrophica]ULQ60096.1 FAD binding domain-containing protein [Brucepastera parasyntrophica]